MVDLQPCESYLSEVNVVIKELMLLAGKDKDARIGDYIQTSCLTFSLPSGRLHRTERAALQIHYRMRTFFTRQLALSKPSDDLSALLSNLLRGNGTSHENALHLSSEIIT
jgi:hypothetical protein